MVGGLVQSGSALAGGAAKTAEALKSEEASLWRVHAGRAREAFSFWSRLLGLRMGPRHDQFLDDAAEVRFGSIIRAMSWVESKHGTAGANQAARDPMQCGKPGDVWWRELTGRTDRQDRFTRGPGLSDLWAGGLPAMAEADTAFPASARISALRNPARGHRKFDFEPDHSFFWAIPYFIHRSNVPASGRTFRCGSASLTRLIEGAVAYNGGGDPRYEAKIRDALEAIGINPEGIDDLRRGGGIVPTCSIRSRLGPSRLPRSRHVSIALNELGLSCPVIVVDAPYFPTAPIENEKRF